MKLHQLKIKAQYFFSIRYKYKTFELRKDDRDYEKWDTIHFVKEDRSDFISDPNNIYIITYILRNCKEYGLEDGYCILGIKRLEEVNSK